MKSVMLSIRPKWVEKIASGEKTIEVRKTAPKEVPFKAYIYETYDKKYADIGICWRNGKTFEHSCKKVIGEFICNLVDEYPYDYCDGVDIDDDTILETAIGREAINIYAKGKTLYGWHISDLKIYDKPKELSEFRTPCKMGDYPCCGIYDYAVHGMDGYLIDCDTSLTRPPQSWCYVEDLTNE